MKLIKNATNQKLRGGFYTPELIADFILKWAFNGTSGQDVLEPSCGDGVFLERMKENNFPYGSITAVELDTQEAEKTMKINLKSTKIINSDFHNFCNKTHEKFDIIVGNPPYIRYQYFDKTQQEEAEKIFGRADMNYSKLTNAWVSFVVGSDLLLKPQGKIGFVLPAELLQVSYAAPLRKYLAKSFHKINIISFKKLVFSEVQQEVVILLCERNGIDKHVIEHLEIDDIDGLKNIDITLLKSPRKEIDFHESKWTFYFLDQKEINFLEDLRRSNRIPKLKDFAKVEVGITTGANSYFTVPQSTVNEYDLETYAKPLVGRSVQVNSLIFTKDDLEQNKKNDVRANLLVFPPIKDMKDNQKALNYLSLGKSQKIDKGYKCGVRDEWQIIPSIRLSDALFIRRNNLFPKMIKNVAKAYTTDTMHRVSISNGVNVDAFVSSYYNSLSLAFSEIVGRSHGGGVLELMPNETEEILLPYKKEHSNMLTTLDKMFRAKEKIDDILDFSDRVILKEGFGFTSNEIGLARTIWKKLSQRRLNRKR